MATFEGLSSAAGFASSASASGSASAPAASALWPPRRASWIASSLAAPPAASASGSASTSSGDAPALDASSAPVSGAASPVRAPPSRLTTAVARGARPHHRRDGHDGHGGHDGRDQRARGNATDRAASAWPSPAPWTLSSARPRGGRRASCSPAIPAFAGLSCRRHADARADADADACEETPAETWAQPRARSRHVSLGAFNDALRAAWGTPAAWSVREDPLWPPPSAASATTGPPTSLTAAAAAASLAAAAAPSATRAAHVVMRAVGVLFVLALFFVMMGVAVDGVVWPWLTQAAACAGAPRRSGRRSRPQAMPSWGAHQAASWTAPLITPEAVPAWAARLVKSGGLALLFISLVVVLIECDGFRRRLVALADHRRRVRARRSEWPVR
ncbi:hypothetical protein CXG81DRAFT_26820 [Caulochytrium protostelioides]|uniref:Uncharacterized protein n=1 Tax=Caulochytrium protostelioides TaxID=1555241 RepID=A0A4P9X5Q4_9FUNG|nr:hypothetical protein CXG81DRAFT_26820 [Caulochytrium protostelioides]|eukprot:RKP00466.1 hypothetical protein CXG81DRAFT_26820 [Caulochytrium protostelioides]